MVIAFPLLVEFIPDKNRHTYNIIQKFSGDKQRWNITYDIQACMAETEGDAIAAIVKSTITYLEAVCSVNNNQITSSDFRLEFNLVDVISGPKVSYFWGPGWGGRSLLIKNYLTV